jgi:hypothetical protein
LGNKLQELILIPIPITLNLMEISESQVRD